jgi:LCP family protein required for cell wall assembly
MTDLKPSTEGGAHNPSAPSQPRPAHTRPATPIKPAQPPAARPALTKPVQPSAAEAAASIKPGSANTRVAAAFGKPGRAKGQPAAPVRPAQPSAAQTASPIKQAQPRAAHTAPTKPPQTNAAQSTSPTTPSPEKAKSAEPVKPDQPSATACTQPGCTGTIVDDYCDVCGTPASAAPSVPAGSAASAASPAPGDAAQTAAPTKSNRANIKPAAPIKPAKPGATKTAATTEAQPASDAKAAATAKPGSTKPAPASRNSGPVNPQAKAPAKPSQPSAAETAASTKPGPPTTHAAAAFIKPGPTKGQPAPSVEPAQPSAAKTAAAIKPDLTYTQADEALIKAAMAQSAALTKPMQTNGAQAVARTKPGREVTRPAPPTKPTQPGIAQTAVSTKPSPARTQAAAPSDPSLSSTQAAAPGVPSPADAEPAAATAKRRRALPIVLASVAATLVAVLGVAAIFVGRVESSLTQNLDREDLMPTDSPQPTKEQVAADALNFVVMGYDSRDASVGRSGSLMILHLNAKRDQAYVISFPRDMWVSIPGRGTNKINAAYGFGGPKLTVSTLEKLTDTRMDHVVLVDFQGFAKLTDEVGGVTVYNKTEFVSHGVNYPKGNITVSGERALYFVGERRLPRGDFDRAANERNVVRAIIAKALSTKIITDPGRLLSVVSGAAEHLTVDKGQTNSRIRSTVLSLRLTDKDVHLMKAPVSGTTKKNGQSVNVVDKLKLAELRTALRQDRVNEYLAKYPQG